MARTVGTTYRGKISRGSENHVMERPRAIRRVAMATTSTSAATHDASMTAMESRTSFGEGFAGGGGGGGGWSR